MIVVATVSQLEHGVAAIEVVAHHQARRLELGQDPIDSGQTDIFAGFHQGLVNILRAHVALLGGVEHLEDLDPRQGHLQAGFTQFVVFNHGQLSRGMQLSQLPLMQV
ncbi:hypothetical protein D9M69_297050 [compost metagenome]